jgi:hypothetical protein
LPVWHIEHEGDGTAIGKIDLVEFITQLRQHGVGSEHDLLEVGREHVANVADNGMERLSASNPTGEGAPAADRVGSRPAAKSQAHRQK